MGPRRKYWKEDE
jgi:hypothetical protein